MLNLLFFLKCYGVGVIGNFSLGPIFLLTFNRSARYGMLKGIAISLGAALADTLLFFLGLTGALSILASITQARRLLFALGTIVLAWLGLHSLQVAHVETKLPYRPVRSLPAASVKAFLMTVTNPMTTMYFMGASIALINRVAFVPEHVGLASALVGLGTFTVLALVSVIASRVGHRISEQALITISRITGGFFLLFASYLGYLFFWSIAH